LTIEQLKKEAETLSFVEKGQLITHLVQLRNREGPGYLAEMRRRLEDREAAHWLAPEEAENRLSDER